MIGAVHIAVNLRLFTEGEIGGLENYIRHVVPALTRRGHQQGERVTLLARRSEAEHLRALSPEATVVTVADELESERVLASGSYDLLFCPLLVLEPLHPRIPAAVLIPDLQHEFLPDCFEPPALRWRTHHYRTSAEHADLIFTLSEHAKQTIVQKYGVGATRVAVVQPGVDPEFFEPQTVEATRSFRSLQLPRDFIYCPANFWPHKNHITLLAAMQLLVRRYPDLILVCTGAPGTGAQRVSDEVRALGLRRHVRLLGHVARPLVVQLYRHARALAFPSRFEGFGIPIVEAFSTGTPVVTSRAGSCEEVAGDAALLVDENDPVGIAAAVSRLLDDPDLVSGLVALGRRRAERFSWQRAVAETLSALDRIGERPPVAPRISACAKPMVSVITPSYNMAAYLEQTILSVLGQDYPHLEYIVMDGGSRDGSLDILRRFQGRLTFVSGPDKGQADAINRGIAQSKGEIIAFLNADDTYLPGAVSTAVRYLNEHQSAGAVYGEGYYVDETGTIIERYPTHPFQASLLATNCFICQPATFMRRDVFESAGRLDADLQFALDYDLWIRFVQIAPMLKVDEYLATSRLHRNNKTLGQRGRIFREIISVAHHHYGYVSLEWLLGYASYLVESRVPGRFESSRPSPVKSALALALGIHYNRGQVVRYARDWAAHVGLAATSFESRWDDGWMSRRYVATSWIPGDCCRVRIRGRHLLPFHDGLRLTLTIGSRRLATLHVTAHGPFEMAVTCQAWMRGGRHRIELRASDTFQPLENGDHRHLSCILDTIVFDDEPGA